MNTCVTRAVALEFWVPGQKALGLSLPRARASAACRAGRTPTWRPLRGRPASGRGWIPPRAGTLAAMEVVRHELRRLARGYARRVGRGRAARWHVALLVLAVAAAFLSRAILPLPGLTWLEGRILPVAFAALALYGLGTLLAVVMTRILRPRVRLLARDLDERNGWRDETTTALSLPPISRARLRQSASPRPTPGALFAASRDDLLNGRNNRRASRASMPGP